jgi:tetratricopeptide (TPR) repeat protein
MAEGNIESRYEDQAFSMHCPKGRRSSTRYQIVSLILFLTAGAILGRSQEQVKAQQPSAAGERFAEATKLLQDGKADQARLAVLEGLKLDPRSVQGYNLLGVISHQQNNFAGSERAFLQALKFDPGSTQAHNNLGNCYVTEKKFDLARNEFLTTLRISPRNRDANYALGSLLLAQREPGRAILYFEHVQPADLPTSLNLTRAYLETGRKDTALELAHRISSTYPKDVRAHFSLGTLLASERQLEAAIHELEIADALMPGSFDILYSLGRTYYENGNNEGRAENVLQRALAVQPDSAQTMFMLAKLYHDQNKDLQAMELLVKAHKLAPENTDVILLLARLSMNQNFPEDALRLLQEGIKIEPKRPGLHAALGECYFTVGKIDKSVDEFRTLIQFDPSAASYALMGLCYRNLGRFDEAKQFLLQGMKRDPQNTACLFNLGYIAKRQGNIKEAEEYLERAVQVNPNYGAALFELAGIKMAEKKYTEALPLLQRCVKVTSRPSEAYYKLALVERALHQTDADFRVFQTLAKNNPTGPGPFQNLFEYLNQRSELPPPEQAKNDLGDLLEEVKSRPEEPKSLYLLAEAYLKLGQVDEAKQAIAKVDQISGGDFRTALGVGVLLTRYRLFPEAIQHFQTALAVDPSSDDATYDLANALFRMGSYTRALDTMKKLSPDAQKDETILALLGDIYAHMGRETEAVKIFQDALVRNPDNDEYYLSLALAQLRAGDAPAAQMSLKKGLTRIPNSGKLLWGLGIVSVVQGNNVQAEQYLKQCVELMPEWPSSYSALAFFYYTTGQISKARDTVKRFVSENPDGPLNVQGMPQALDAAANSATPVTVARALSPEERQQFLQYGLALADVAP